MANDGEVLCEGIRAARVEIGKVLKDVMSADILARIKIREQIEEVDRLLELALRFYEDAK